MKYKIRKEINAISFYIEYDEVPFEIHSGSLKLTIYFFSLIPSLSNSSLISSFTKSSIGIFNFNEI